MSSIHLFVLNLVIKTLEFNFMRFLSLHFVFLCREPKMSSFSINIAKSIKKQITCFVMVVCICVLFEAIELSNNADRN